MVERLKISRTPDVRASPDANPPNNGIQKQQFD